ncbi:MAG: hypothetical protein IKL40_05155 [Clostridia bacterium]|nr:hypothetical protein [Clostridia bacterium]
MSNKKMILAIIAIAVVVIILAVVLILALSNTTGKNQEGTDVSETQDTTVDETTEDLTENNDNPDENKTVVDLIMFMGQSNMAGRGVAAQAPKVPEGHGYEFRAVSDPTKLYPITEPFGAKENSGVVTETSKTGSMVSAFVNEYYANRQVPVVGVSCSKGATAIDFWKVDGPALNEAIERHNEAKKWLEENGYAIGRDFMVWCQGETDGGKGVTGETYKSKFKAIIEEMISEAGIEFCAVVRIGNNRNDAKLYDNIIKAQTEFCKSYDKAVMVSTKMAAFASEGKMKDEFHYVQSAYNEVGTDAGKNTASYINTGVEPSMYDPEYKNTYPTDEIVENKESSVSSLEFKFDSANENGIDLTSIGTVKDGALNTTDKNKSANGVPLAETIKISPSQSFTIEFVIDSTSSGVVLGSGSDKGGFLYCASQKVRLRLASSSKQFDAAIEIKNGQKTHIAIVYDASSKTLQVYQDYVAKTVTGNISSFTDLTFTHLCGGYTNANNTYYYQGSLHYFKYVNEALTTAQFHHE